MRRVKQKWMYSYAGIVTGGAALFALLQMLSRLLSDSWLTPERILRLFVAITFLLTVFLTVSGVALLRHEGVRARNLTGAALGIAWTAVNLLGLLLAERHMGPRLLGQFAAVFGCYVDFWLSGVILLAFVAARHKPAYDKDFIIIPGCSISKQGGLLPLLKGRTNRAIRFAWDQERASGKPARYIPTGGQGADEVMSEGSAMEFYLLSHGAESYEVFPEKLSTNTYENMLFSKKIIDAAMPEARTCFVTTNYHVLRSGLLAKKIGLNAEGLASGTKWYFWPNGLAREIVAILSMYPWQQLAALGICGALCAVV